MPSFYCISCAAKNDYSGVKPKVCKFCNASTDPLKDYKARQSVGSVTHVNPTVTTKNSTPHVQYEKRRVNRWGSEGNVVMSEDELAEAGDGDTLESIGLDTQSFAAKVEGDVAAPMTVESLRASSATFVRPTLSPEMQAIQAEALKHMLKGKA